MRNQRPKISRAFRTPSISMKIGTQTNLTPSINFYLVRNKKIGLHPGQIGIETLLDVVSQPIFGVWMRSLVGSRRLVIWNNYYTGSLV